MIKLRDLQYLDAVVTHKHFGKAAEACHVSQPTLSTQLMKLEEQLNLQLIERHKKQIMLTPAGEKLVTDARRVLRAADAFEASAKAMLDPLAGDLQMGLIPTLAPYLLGHIIDDLNTALPKLSCYLHENKTQNLLADLNNGKLDCLVLPWLAEMDQYERYDLFPEPFIFAAHPSHRLAERKEIAITDLEGERILTLEDGHCLRDQALDYCFTAGASEDHRFQATSLETLRYMVAGNLGATLLPALAVNNAMTTQNIRYIPITNPEPTRQISLVIRPNYARMECIRAVVSSIKKSIKTVI